jgi:protein-S-isoprenylcysteine O-methyltransferase Ste14
MEPPQEEQKLRVGSFATHSARGLIRDRASRRKAMVAAVVVALALVLCGATVLRQPLNPHEHAVRFVLYWFACAWVTVLALLLAVFDLLMVRRDGRALRENLQRQFSADTNVNRDDR